MTQPATDPPGVYIVNYGLATDLLADPDRLPIPLAEMLIPCVDWTNPVVVPPRSVLRLDAYGDLLWQRQGDTLMPVATFDYANQVQSCQSATCGLCARCQDEARFHEDTLSNLAKTETTIGAAVTATDEAASAFAFWADRRIGDAFDLSEVDADDVLADFDAARRHLRSARRTITAHAARARRDSGL
jgi:hypothetical protein